MGYISDSKSYKEYIKYTEMQINPKYIGTVENFFNMKIETEIKQYDDYFVKDEITKAVMLELAERSRKGYKKYGTTLHENNHQNMLQHAYEEVLDLAQYLKKEIDTLNTIQDLVKQYPNDADLGEQLRLRYAKK
jgi:hypothetical protein